MGLRQAQALGDGERIAGIVRRQRLQHTLCAVKLNCWLMQPPVGVEASPATVHDARRRQDEVPQLLQRLRSMVIQVNEQRGQGEDVSPATPPPAPQSLPPQPNGEVRTPAKLVCCLQPLECFVELVRFVKRDVPRWCRRAAIGVNRGERQTGSCPVSLTACEKCGKEVAGFW